MALQRRPPQLAAPQRRGGETRNVSRNFGDEALRNINASAISLRYRLLPYIYSGFARVASEGYTMQRGLPMAFPEDPSGAARRARGTAPAP